MFKTKINCLIICCFLIILVLQCVSNVPIIVEVNKIDQNIHLSEVNSSTIINDIYDSLRKANQTAEKIRSLKASLMLNYMDLSADPCEDFYQYACGNFDKLHHIPDDYSQFNVFSVLRDNLAANLKDLLSQDLNSTDNVESPQDQTLAFYTSCMDQESIKNLGAKPLQDLIESFGGWIVTDDDWNPDEFDWINFTSYATNLGISTLIGLGVFPDLEQTDQYAVTVEEAIFSLASREMYFNSNNSAIFEGYRVLIEDVLILLEIEPNIAKKLAKEIIEFEVELVNITKTEENNDLEPFNFLTVQELNEKHPKIDWIRFVSSFLNASVDPDQRVILDPSNFYDKLPELLETQDNRIVANYVLWQIAYTFFKYLDSRFIEVHDNFTKIKTGQLVSLPLWKECVASTNTFFGAVLSGMYVKNYFDATARDVAESLALDIQETFKGMIKSADWLDEPTRAAAQNKINASVIGMGYPDYILDQDILVEEYKDLLINKNTYFENVLSIYKSVGETQRLMLSLPVDKTKWEKYPTEVNAFTALHTNGIFVLAALLQPPIYHRNFPKFANYGALGMFLGHEVTHGFDSMGRLFDYQGNMINWWSTHSLEAFQEKSECFKSQYGNYSMRGISVKGDASLKENVADNGGLIEAYYSYKRWLENTATPDDLLDEILPGFNATNYQMFFVSFAQTWCESIRLEHLKYKLETDPHCPGHFRVVGTLSNFKEFADEFQCPEDARMNPRNKCKLW